MKRIGLLGGMSWESSLDYYRLLNEMVKNRLGGLHSAECTLASVDFGPVSEMLKSNDWKGIERVLTAAAIDLKRAGADFLIICTNTMHLLAREIEGASELEVLEIGKAVGEEIERRGLETVGLLGTRFTMERAYYKDTLAGFGINVIVPSAEEMVVVDRIIFEELCKGIFREESKSVYKAVIKGLQVNGAEGVILGCTEIPLLIKESDADIAVFDTTAIHARAAVDHALA